MDEQFWDRLERDGLLTRTEIAQARARHAAAGGAPDTAINEVRPLATEDRARLRRLLARAVDQPLAPPAFLDAPEPEALAFLPRELADRHSVLAARLTPQLLTIVVPALPPRVMAELSFVVGRKIQPYVALESDVRHALSRHLGLPMPPRFQALGAPPPTPPPLTGAESVEHPSVPGGSGVREPLGGDTQLKGVDRGWATSGRGLPALRSLRSDAPPEVAASQPPAPIGPVTLGTGSRDWVARALESLRNLPDPAQLAHALGQIGAPGMVDLVFLRRTEAGLDGYVASHGGVALEGIGGVHLPADADTIIGRALLKGATRCGPYREDASFAPLFAALGLPAPSDILVAPIKRGESVVGVFVGDHGAQAIAPVTASAVRRLLAGLADTWPPTPVPEPRAPVETLLGVPAPSLLSRAVSVAPVPEPAPAAPTPARDHTAELVALTPATRFPSGLPSEPPAPDAPVDLDDPGDPPGFAPGTAAAESVDASGGRVDSPPDSGSPHDASSPLPEWILPERSGTSADTVGETLLGMPALESAAPARVDIELFDPEDVAEMAAAMPELRPEALTETRPGQVVLGTRPMLPSVTQSRMGAAPLLGDTTVDQRPMGLAELADALALEAGSRATQTQSAVVAFHEQAGRGPTPQLLDLDNMVTVPALARVRPSAPAVEPPLAPEPTTPEPAPPGAPMLAEVRAPSAAPTESPPVTPAAAPADAPRTSLPFPSPGWTDELPLPAVTAVRAIRIDSTATDFDLSAMRFAAQSHAPSAAPPAVVPTAPPAPMPAAERFSFHPTPFDPPTGPQPRVTVILTPTPEADADEFDVPPLAGVVEVAGLPDPAPEPAPPPPRSAPPPEPAPVVESPRRTYSDADVRLAIEGLASPDAARRQQAEDLLLAVGEPALEPIFDAFPGQLLIDRFAHPVGTPAVEAHSALLKVIVRLGPLATGRLEALCSHLSPEIRYYAVFCFSTLRSARSLPIVAERLTDSDAGVRDIAVCVLEHYRGQNAFKQVVESLRAALKEGPARRRRPLVDAVGRLHLADAIPELLAMLGDLSLGLQETAHKALLEIARADLGLDAWKWQKWYDRNGNRPRVEWLLEGLLSDHRAIRAGAFQELRRLTHQNYGYLVDAPPSERRSAHERWMRWWRDAGMLRFAGYR